MQRSTFGPYRVVRLLGQGGMGAVYEAVGPAGDQVAVKTLPVHLADDDAVRRRFRSEIDLLMRLRHPGIARMIGFGEEDGLPFFAMEFVPGRTLDELLRSGRRFTWPETVAVALEILPALKSAHDQGVVHRDLKPANLMFPPADGGGFHVKLTDFGIAKLFGDTGHTRAGIVVGTPEYMAPEQAAAMAVDHRADLYCLGLVMFAMLAGRPPFQGGVSEVVEHQKTRRPPRISTAAADVPPPLDELLDRLLAKNPEARPPNAAAVARLLAGIAAGRPPGAITAPHPEPAVSRPAPDLAATLAMPPAAPGGGGGRADVQATTVADEIGRQVPADPQGHQAGGSTFTTVEAVARSARDRQARSERRRAMLGACGAGAVITAVLAAGWWLLLRPWPWADPDAERRDYESIIAMLADPDDLGDPCREIRSYLVRHPAAVHAADVRRLGREVALDRLHKRSRHRFPTYTPKSPAERTYLEALRLAASDARAATVKLRGMLAAPGKTDAPQVTDDDPCAVVERPDADTWRELARRQVEMLEPVVRLEDAARREESRDAASRAAAMLDQAAALQREIDAAPTAARRVVAITRRHQVLEELVEDYAATPAAAATVAEARRLLGH
ncbi:MAG: serine/threonine-protein kinase [Planctomycetaceae bacterium]